MGTGNMRYGLYFETKIGRLYAEEEKDFLVCLSSGPAAADKTVPGEQGISFQETSLLLQTKAEILEFLAGERKEFDIPVYLKGTDFQKRVWKALTQIPFGETRTYGRIAAAAGSPKSARAVGQACHRNPVMIIVPCHRVIGANGKLVGFGGGLPLKETLLSMEKELISMEKNLISGKKS